MSELFKALSGHLIPQLFLLSFLVSLIFATVSGSHDVTQLLLICFSQTPLGETLFALYLSQVI